MLKATRLKVVQCIFDTTPFFSALLKLTL